MTDKRHFFFPAVVKMIAMVGRAKSWTRGVDVRPSVSSLSRWARPRLELGDEQSQHAKYTIVPD